MRNSIFVVSVPGLLRERLRAQDHFGIVREINGRRDFAIFQKLDVAGGRDGFFAGDL